MSTAAEVAESKKARYDQEGEGVRIVGVGGEEDERRWRVEEEREEKMT